MNVIRIVIAFLSGLILGCSLEFILPRTPHCPFNEQTRYGFRFSHVSYAHLSLPGTAMGPPFEQYLKSISWLQPNPSNLPWCSISDEFVRAYPQSLPSRLGWAFGNSPSKGTCIPYIDLREREQREFYINVCVKRYKSEVDSWQSATSPVRPSKTWWQASEAAIQFCILREFKPRRLIEVGSGTSTRFAAHAMLRNAREGFKGSLVAIDPAPRTLDDNKGVKSRPDLGFTFSSLKKSVTDVPLAFSTR